MLPVYRLIGLGLALAPAAGVFGAILLFLWQAVTYSGLWGGTLLGRLIMSFPASLIFGLTLGTIFALPVTVLVLPIVRALLPSLNTISLISLAAAGAISGFCSPMIIWKVISGHISVAAAFFAPVSGSITGFVAAIVYFYLTRQNGQSRRELDHNQRSLGSTS